MQLKSLHRRLNEGLYRLFPTLIDIAKFNKPELSKQATSLQVPRSYGRKDAMIWTLGKQSHGKSER